MALFITFEGGEGTGKSTALKAISAYFEENKIPFILSREPGGTPIGEEIRNVILSKNNGAMDLRVEALLFAASRRQHLVEKIWPALESGVTVLCDRYLDSSLAYQGNARGLGIENVLRVNNFATEGTFPDVTLFFDLDPEVGLQRIASNNQREVNRLDLEKMAFHKSVREGFLKLARMYPERYVVIDASKSQEEVAASCINAIKERMGK